MTVVLFFSDPGVVGPPVVPPEPPPPTPEPPSGGIEAQTHYFWEELYGNLTPFHYGEPDNDYALRKFCQAISLPFELVHFLVRDDQDTGKIGWSAAFDPTRAPDSILPWLQQFVGAGHVAGETPADLRQRIKDADAFRRGTIASIMDAAARVGCTAFQIDERDSGSPWRIKMWFIAAEYTGDKFFEIAKKVPAGIIIDVDFFDGVTYEDIRTTYSTYFDAETSNTDYTDLRGG